MKREIRGRDHMRHQDANFMVAACILVCGVLVVVAIVSNILDWHFHR